MEKVINKLAATPLCEYISMYGDVLWHTVAWIGLSSLAWLYLELRNSNGNTHEVKTDFVGSIILISAPPLTYVGIIIGAIYR